MMRRRQTEVGVSMLSCSWAWKRVGISSKIHDPVIRYGSERLLRDLLASSDESNDGKNSNYGGYNCSK